MISAVKRPRRGGSEEDAANSAPGLASGGVTVVVPMYIGELAPPDLRGALGTAFQLTVTLSMLAGQLLGLPTYNAQTAKIKVSILDINQ